MRAGNRLDLPWFCYCNRNESNEFGPKVWVWWITTREGAHLKCLIMSEGVLAKHAKPKGGKAPAKTQHKTPVKADGGGVHGHSGQSTTSGKKERDAAPSSSAPGAAATASGSGSGSGSGGGGTYSRLTLLDHLPKKLNISGSDTVNGGPSSVHEATIRLGGKFREGIIHDDDARVDTLLELLSEVWRSVFIIFLSVHSLCSPSPYQPL